ncbi:MAG: IS4 family transposase [Desulfobulbaceae bacterium DB1]|nr:MAG: IS4 family transposase [Desulfobulbaceae bacterium DB1]
MAHYNTILNQITAILPRHEFECLAQTHHVGQKFRSFNRWSQFLAMMIAQLSSRKSLRDLTDNLKAQANKLYHLGMRKTSRATLARVNDKQPAELYKVMFYKLLERCQQHAPKHKFKFKGKLFLLDATTIKLCLSIFPWAKFRKTKGAIKLHVGLDADGYLPSFMTMTDGKGHEVQWAKALNLPKGSCVVFDRGFTDYTWYESLMSNGIFFVTRLKSNALVQYFKNRPGRKSTGVTMDRQIQLGDIPQKLRLIAYTDPETGIEYRFVTNADHLQAKTIADLYKERWQIELFFKWIKQNLKIKTFLGTSQNSVLTQIWIALCVYLILAYLKFTAKIGISMQQILRILQLNLFERRDLLALLKPPKQKQPTIRQFLLWGNL